METIIENYYIINLGKNNDFGIWYTSKEKAIEVFKNNLETEIKLGKTSEHWKKHSDNYLEMLRKGEVKIITKRVKKEIITTDEVLKLDNIEREER